MSKIKKKGPAANKKIPKEIPNTHRYKFTNEEMRVELDILRRKKALFVAARRYEEKLESVRSGKKSRVPVSDEERVVTIKLNRIRSAYYKRTLKDEQ